MHIPHFLPMGLLTLLWPALLQAREPMRLWGQVRHGSAAVPGAQVIAANQDTCRCDEHGNYSFPALSHGPLQLRVQAPGYAPLRLGWWLRQEAFLALSLQRERHPAGGFPADSLAERSAALAVWHDLDRDGREDHAGARPLQAPVQLLENGLPREDAWGGSWPAASPRVSLGDASRPAWQPSGTDGFFSNTELGGWASGAPPHPLPSFWLEQKGDGTSSLGGGVTRALGLWQEASLRARVERTADRSADLGRSGQVLDLGLGHRWLSTHALSFEQGLLLSQARRRDLSSTTPYLWLPAASLEAWRGARLEQSQLSWLGRASWLPTEGTAGELLLWWRRRSQDAQGEEWDRVLHRLLPSEAQGAPDWIWFQTRREEVRRAVGMRAALQQEHERGWLQGALSFESHTRRQDASVGRQSWLPAGRNPWLALEEQTLLLEARLRDHWDWTPRLAFEACLDLRYHFYELRRLPVGLFQLSDVPEVAFNQDLLALEPRCALDWRPGTWRVEAAWQRRLAMLGPQEAWDLGRSLERLTDLPLVAAIGSEGELETVLPAESRDRVQLAAMRSFTPALRLNLDVWGERVRHLPLAGWTRRDASLDPSQLVQPLSGLQGGLTGGLRLKGADWHLLLEGRWSCARVEGILWRPLADTSLWVGRPAVLRHLPGEPAWVALLEGGARLRGKGWEARPLVQVHGLGARHPENQAGWSAELPATLRLDAELGLSLSSRPAWSLTLWGQNLGGDTHPASAWLVWRAAEQTPRRSTLAATGRLLGLRLSWEPGS